MFSMEVFHFEWKAPLGKLFSILFEFVFSLPTTQNRRRQEHDGYPFFGSRLGTHWKRSSGPRERNETTTYRRLFTHNIYTNSRRDDNREGHHHLLVPSGGGRFFLMWEWVLSCTGSWNHSASKFSLLDAKVGVSSLFCLYVHLELHK